MARRPTRSASSSRPRPISTCCSIPSRSKFKRRNIPLDPERFQYLEGCVRKEQPYEVPDLCEEQ